MPGFELMLKANGKKKEADLQKYVKSLGCPFRIFVVTGQSGSYKEDGLIAMQDLLLQEWGPNREWEGWLGCLLGQRRGTTKAYCPSA